MKQHTQSLIDTLQKRRVWLDEIAQRPQPSEHRELVSQERNVIAHYMAILTREIETLEGKK
ncbi:hypothetical protein [Moraxella lacunata]|uniref:Uncharacterized protein n=1 Tax=Moraxella lacunata TaxID=477 RepID=A0A1V4GV72_MORLA|nr:hypothetical protein [Moraxella lacunata]OPH36517.1 hypothetical protein B5J94_07235 [Moraxella lacunata]